MVAAFRRASKGHISSMTEVADKYKHSNQSSYWLRLAAWNGCPRATLALAKMRNENVKHLLEMHLNDPEIAEAYVELQMEKPCSQIKDLLHKGVSIGRPRSLYLMGRLHEMEGKDPCAYYMKASAQGDLDAASLCQVEDG